MITNTATQNLGPQLGLNTGRAGLRGCRLLSPLRGLTLLVSLLGAVSGCAARAPSVSAEVKTSADSPSPDAQSGVSIPFALCRSFGIAGTPCYPTNVDIGSRVISPCRERQRGHCELSGPRQTMACLLAPVADGKTCGAAGVCKDGVCTSP